MADVIRKATNRFTKGLVLDFSPENTKNEVLTQALNATFLTFNGNELSLQNDMGNARVETAYLPEGYMPVGTCEYGGIIYIVSYNPLENKSQIGCFPSPERNISNDELGKSDAIIERQKFQKFNEGIPTGDIVNTTQYVLLKNDHLNPGDKFIICANKSIYNERLADLWVDKDPKHYDKDDPNDFELVSNPIISLNVVSIEDSGKIVYLNSDVKKYEETNTWSTVDESENTVEYTDKYKYHILGKMIDGASQLAKDDLDEYRNVLNSGYSVFKSKTSGKLAILAELLTIDSYSVTHSIVPKTTVIDDKEVVLEGSFDIIIHTDVSPTVTTDNYNTVPKLQYYYLQNSQGYLQTTDDSGNPIVRTLFALDNTGKVTQNYNRDFLKDSLQNIYTPTVEDSLGLDQPLDKTGQFNFPRPYTYHGHMQSWDVANGTIDNSVYTKFTEGKYHRVLKSQVIDNYSYYKNNIQAKFYYYDGSKSTFTEVEKTQELENTYTYYVKTTEYKYIDAHRNSDAYNNPETVLYKYASEPHAASDRELKNELIEKFQQVDIHTYREATYEDFLNETEFYQKDENSNKYTQITGKPVIGQTYYVLEIEQAYVSIGTGEVNAEDYPGQIYYYPSAKDYIIATEDDLKVYWDFVKYPKTEEAPWGCPEMLYYRREEETYRLATEKELAEFTSTQITLYYNADYVYVDNIDLFEDSQYQLFIVTPIDTYVSSAKFKPDVAINYIQGCEKPKGIGEPEKGFPKDDPITLFTVSDFIPNNLGDMTALDYNDLNLANIKIPTTVSANGLDLPFKYDYTLVPCMNFGRLNHLAVSNTIDFSKLHAFNQSDFTTWKYYINDDQLRLTFGADIYDTYESNKVDALILEFYDLWGYAGSVEITDKKSYSGVFTKIIPLNTLKALNTKRIEGVRYSNTPYRRNINITEKQPKNQSEDVMTTSDSKEFWYNNARITWGGYSNGWSGIDESTDDCGTLYSNMVYGVKTYLRRTSDNGDFQFIPKKEFFLYTLPILNDYYYTINDFSTITKPQLELMLTYKLKDQSSKIPYASDTITNGFYNNDNDLIRQYLSGFLQGVSTINTVKYYKYVGTSELNLEIGLKQDYQNLNLSYSPTINEYFTCDLSLMSDDDDKRTYSVITSDGLNSNIEQSLNYIHKSNIPISSSVNKLGFESSLSSTKSIADNFTNYNFLYNNNPKSIPINYEFVVGCKVDINDIRTTEIQATTICALLHKDTSGNYNYEDFGIYEQTGGNGNTQYLSNAMFYNGGTVDKEVFGICRQIDTLKTTMIEQCQSITSVETDAKEIRTAGKLNSGDPLKQMAQHIGKLTFCQPHAHGLSEYTGVNIHEGQNTRFFGIAPDISVGDAGDSEDDTQGTAPRSFLFNNPRYNLSLNTKNAINYNSEFLSTIDWNVITSGVYGVNVDDSNDAKNGAWKDNVEMREYTGFDGNRIASFNKTLMETMKSVYAYNPDYDSLAVNVGEVRIQDKQIKITSNLLSTKSSITFPENYSLNDFIYLGSVKFSDYLEYLNQYSEDYEGYKIKTYNIQNGVKMPLEQVQLVEDLTYCGTDESPYLISNLTYNIPVPDELESELSFKSSNSLIVKHSDGTTDLMNGVPDKKVLYGYNSELGKLIQLDVSNYKISSNGKLTFKDSAFTTEIQNVSTSPTKSLLDDSISNEYIMMVDFNGEDPSQTEAYIRFRIGNGRILQTSEDSIIIASERKDSNESSGLYLDLDFAVKKSDQKGYAYHLSNQEISLSCDAVILNHNELKQLESDSGVSMEQFSYEALDALVGLNSEIAINGSYYEAHPLYTTDAYTMFYDNVETDKIRYMQCKDQALINVEPLDKKSSSALDIELYKLTLNSIDFAISRNRSLKDMSTSIVKIAPTRKYSSIVGNKYVVDNDYNDARIRGTSLTLNDLVYEPNQTGHRLFVKNNCCVYNSEYRGKLYYRSLSVEDRASWDARRTVANRYLNSIFLFTGPCFTSDNL